MNANLSNRLPLNRLCGLMFLVMSLIFSACAPAAAPAKLVEAPKAESQSRQAAPALADATGAEKIVEVEKVVKETSVVQEAAPAATAASKPDDVTFKDYGFNPYVDTIEDHYSTFALDVDTASYSVARSYINQGMLPPTDAIRAEEFVNYFDQGYAAPADVAFSIYADGAPSPFDANGLYLLRFGVQGYRIPEFARKSAILTFVIDVSGSMREGGRLELVKQALSLLVERLRPDDSVSIVAYTDTTWVVLEPTPGDNRDAILNAISQLYPKNSTNAEAGIRLGYKQALKAYRSGATNRVILCSDGVANVGNTSPEGILAEVRGYVDEGVTLTAIGVGMGNFNDVLLEQLADNGDGNYAYVDTLDEARKVLVDDLVSTLEVIAYDAKVQVDFNPDVVARYRLIGYVNRAVADEDFRNDSVDAGEIGAGHSATAIYAVQFKSNASGRIATVQLRWQDPQTREVREINGNFNTWDLANDFASTAPHYQLAVIVAQYAELLGNSPWASQISASTLSEYASALPGLLPEDADVAEFADLVARTAQIRR